MISLERGRYRWARAAGTFARLLRYVDAELRTLLQEYGPELEQDFVAYIVAGYRVLFPDLDFAEQDLHSLQALRHQMITLAETCQRERQDGEQAGWRIGEQEGWRKALTEYVHLCWDEEISQAFRQRLSALDAAFWPSLRALHAAYQEGRDPLQLLRNESNGYAPAP